MQPELLAGLGLAASVLAVVQALWLERRARRLSEALRRAALIRQDRHLADLQLRALVQTQRFAEANVSSVTALVRGVHHGIARIPFSILERIPLTRGVTRVVHGIHDVTADSVYGAIGAVNRLLGSQLRRGLNAAQTDDGHSPQEVDHGTD